MTPFIDVMLVLVIVFMVSAAQVIDYPVEDLAHSVGKLVPEYIAISINDQSEVFLMDKMVADTELFDKLRALVANRIETKIFLRASKIVPYGRVVDIVNELAAKGYKNVAIVTDPKP